MDCSSGTEATFEENRAPARFERAVAGLFRVYPLVNGCGTIASSKLAKALLPAQERNVWTEVQGRPCLVPLNDLVGRAIFLCGELDRKVGMTVKRYVEPGDVVLDVGANLGLVTLQMANRGAGRILAFEPNPMVLRLLEETLSANDDVEIDLHRVALGRENGRLTLETPAGNMGKATLNVGKDFKANHSTVPVVRLSDILHREEIKALNFMKLDVEGFETQVLEGLFSGPVRPTYILFEDNDIKKSDTIRLLREEGYVIKGLSAPHHIRLVEVDETNPDFSRCHDFLAKYRPSTE